MGTRNCAEMNLKNRPGSNNAKIRAICGQSLLGFRGPACWRTLPRNDSISLVAHRVLALVKGPQMSDPWPVYYLPESSPGRHSDRDGAQLSVRDFRLEKTRLMFK